MGGFYEVTLGEDAVGKVELRRQGLYCRVICRCHIPQQPICRLYAMTEKGRENLGVPVPDGDGFLLDKRIPAKRLGQGAVRFVLSAGAGKLSGIFAPIGPEEPYRYMERLKNVFLEQEKGQTGKNRSAV